MMYEDEGDCKDDEDEDDEDDGDEDDEDDDNEELMRFGPYTLVDPSRLIFEVLLDPNYGSACLKIVRAQDGARIVPRIEEVHLAADGTTTST